MSDLRSKAAQAYWDSLWNEPFNNQWVNPRDKSIRNSVNIAFHKLFQEVLSKSGETTRRLLEVGCAQSAWLPYFHKELGFEVAGIDYSGPGCTQARKLLEQAEVPGEIVQADFFDPPKNFEEAFDVVVSFGVVEHFYDTAKCLKSLAAFAKPGGCIITIIPNMRGLPGYLQKHFGRQIYDLHVPLSREELADANMKAGLVVRQCDYFFGLNWGVLVLPDWRNNVLTRPLCQCLSLISYTYWWFERKGFRIPPNEWTSPYLVNVSFRNGCAV